MKIFGIGLYLEEIFMKSIDIMLPGSLEVAKGL